MERSESSAVRLRVLWYRASDVSEQLAVPVSRTINFLGPLGRGSLYQWLARRELPTLHFQLKTENDAIFDMHSRRVTVLEQYSSLPQ
jgi:hypothetical protein